MSRECGYCGAKVVYQGHCKELAIKIAALEEELAEIKEQQMNNLSISQYEIERLRSVVDATRKVLSVSYWTRDWREVRDAIDALDRVEKRRR